MSNTIYMMGFNMPEPMKSRKNVANSFLVVQDMIKIGISTNYQRRSKIIKTPIILKLIIKAMYMN